MKKLVCMALVLMMVVSCAVYAIAEEKPVLSVMVLVSSEDGTDSRAMWIKNAYQNWDKKDEVELDLQEVYGSSGDYLTKLQLVCAAENTAPDLVFEDSFQLTADVAAGLIADITDYVVTWDTWNNGTMVEAMKSQTTVGESVYAIPATTDTRGLLYNKNVFVEAGILESIEEEWQPQDWSEVLSAMYAIKENCDGVIPFWSPMSAAEGEGTTMHNFETWFYSTGEELMHNDDGNWNFDGQAWEDTATFLSTIVNDGLTMDLSELLDAKPSSYAYTYFSQNKLGIILMNSNIAASQFREGANYAMEEDYREVIGLCMVPKQYGGGYSSMSGGWTWSVAELSDQKDLACEFLFHMMEKENYADFIIAYNSLSVLDLTDVPEYIDRPFTKEATDMVAYTHFRPHDANYSAVSVCIYQMVENLVTGMSVDDALEIFRSDAAFAIGE